MDQSALTDERSRSGPSPLRLAANRRNALKSTGPRTAAGKRRASLNNARRGLVPSELENEFRARGEDPREFRRLHRDLVALFEPADPGVARVVQLLAETWWEKARRIRQWVAAGQPRSDDLDGRLETMLLLAIDLQRLRHERWQVRLTSVLGGPLESPAAVRQRIEQRLHIFGARRWQRKYPPPRSRSFSADKVEKALREMLGTTSDRPGGEAAASEDDRSQPPAGQGVADEAMRSHDA